ncbi:unnamed protein product [Victoria cruziana]
MDGSEESDEERETERRRQPPLFVWAATIDDFPPVFASRADFFIPPPRNSLHNGAAALLHLSPVISLWRLVLDKCAATELNRRLFFTWIF